MTKAKLSYCPKGHTAFSWERFCWKCGDRLVEQEELKCPGCRRVLVGVEVFCTKCGRRLKDEATGPEVVIM